MKQVGKKKEKKKMAENNKMCSFIFNIYQYDTPVSKFNGTLATFAYRTLLPDCKDAQFEFICINFYYQKTDDKKFVCNFSKNVKSKLYHTENSKLEGR